MNRWWTEDPRARAEVLRAGPARARGARRGGRGGGRVPRLRRRVVRDRRGVDGRRRPDRGIVRRHRQPRSSRSRRAGMASVPRGALVAAGRRRRAHAPDAAVGARRLGQDDARWRMASGRGARPAVRLAVARAARTTIPCASGRASSRPCARSPRGRRRAPRALLRAPGAEPRGGRRAAARQRARRARRPRGPRARRPARGARRARSTARCRARRPPAGRRCTSPSRRARDPPLAARRACAPATS